MKIYLDNCCLNRPFDDLSNDAVRIEAEAIVTIIDRCENGGWELLISDVIMSEINMTPDIDRRAKVLLMCRPFSDIIKASPEIFSRAETLKKAGIKTYDAFHIASAELGGANVFLTTDRRLINASARADIKILVSNPAVWLMEVLYQHDS